MYDAGADTAANNKKAMMIMTVMTKTTIMVVMMMTTTTSKSSSSPTATPITTMIMMRMVMMVMTTMMMIVHHHHHHHQQQQQQDQRSPPYLHPNVSGVAQPVESEDSKGSLLGLTLLQQAVQLFHVHTVHCQVVVRVTQLEGAVSNQDNDNEDDNNGTICPIYTGFWVKL